MRRLSPWLAPPLALVLGACINLRPMPPDQPCKEAGYAIASRVFDCTADADAANAAFRRFEQDVECVLYDLEARDDTGSAWEKDLFHCALAIGAMDCEEVLACGEDTACFLAASPTCALVAQTAAEAP